MTGIEVHKDFKVCESDVLATDVINFNLPFAAALSNKPALPAKLNNNDPSAGAFFLALANSSQQTASTINWL